jgi:hypothetical protein
MSWFSISTAGFKAHKNGLVVYCRCAIKFTAASDKRRSGRVGPTFFQAAELPSHHKQMESGNPIVENIDPTRGRGCPVLSRVIMQLTAIVEAAPLEPRRPAQG